MRKIIFILFLSLASIGTNANGGGVAQAKSMSVSLNVYNQSLNIKFNGNQSSAIENIYVMNLVGRKMDEIKYVAGTEQLIIASARNYPSGIYVILAKDINGKIIESAKITINK